MLITFADQLSSSNASLKDLEYSSSEEQQMVLNEFVQHHVFSTQQEGEHSFRIPIQSFSNRFLIADAHDETRIEELHKRRNYLAAYCKLIVYNVIPVKAAADIFKHYLRVGLSLYIKMEVN